MNPFERKMIFFVFLQKKYLSLFSDFTKIFSFYVEIENRAAVVVGVEQGLDLKDLLSGDDERAAEPHVDGNAHTRGTIEQRRHFVWRYHSKAFESNDTT